MTIVAMLLLTVAVNCSEGQENEGAPAVPQAQPAAATAPTAPAGATMDDAHRAQAQKLASQGVQWLLAHRDEDGGWSIGDQQGFKAAVTAMALKALLQDPQYGPGHEAVKKGFDVLLRYRQDNGGIYDPREGQENYTTAVAVMALAASGDPQHKPALDAAVKYLKGIQIVPGAESPDGDAIDAEHPMMGGVSYGKHGRPDLSNLGMWMQALEDAGVPNDDPAIQKALTFVTRTQNLSETNPQPWAKDAVNDGGFIYAPAIQGDLAMGESKAGEVPGGRGLRSYGSMTYVGFKSLLYAGVERQDPRVQGAFKWIRRYWRLDSNPNMPDLQSLQGLYYYYHTFAKALRAWGEPVITDLKGEGHNWREELIAHLATLQKPGGYWENAEPRWFEGSKLATIYTVLALQETMK